MTAKMKPAEMVLTCCTAERSRDALIRRFPELADTLLRTGSCRPVFDGDGAVIDVDLGTGARLYSADGRRLVADQVAAFLADPVRSVRTEVDKRVYSTAMGRRILRSVVECCVAMGLSGTDFHWFPEYRGTYLIILGVGLGFHLRELIQSTRAGYVILVEPFPDLLRLSAMAIDWQALLNDLDGTESRLQIVTGSEASAIALTIASRMRDEGEPFADGCYTFVHYPAKLLLDIRERLAHLFRFYVFMSTGFYEDDRLMLINGFENLARHSVCLVPPLPSVKRIEPFFVIGAGPSLDQAIAHVRRLRDRILVMTCGTALRACLANGIVPDFHCESENAVSSYDALAITLAEHKAREIVLVAASTVDPRIPTLFKTCLLYLRQDVSSTRLLDEEGWEMRYALPTVTNAGLRLAVAFGFVNIHLVGVDYGWKTPGCHHAAETVYHDVEEFQIYDQEMVSEREAPGNFGGTVYTDDVFWLAADQAAIVGRIPGVRMVNCSEGVRIETVQPQRIERLRFSVLDRLQGTVVADVVGRCRPLAAGELLASIDRSAMGAAVARYRSDLLKTLDRLIAGEVSMLDLWRGFEPFLAPRAYAGLSCLFVGSLRSLPKIAMFYLVRIPDEAHRRVLWRHFLMEFRTVVMDMCDDAAAVLKELP